MPVNKIVKVNNESVLNVTEDTSQSDQVNNLAIESRIKDYSLNIHRALEKKIGSCSRAHIAVNAHDKVNNSLVFSTAAFEVAKQSMDKTFQYTDVDLQQKKIEFYCRQRQF